MYQPSPSGWKCAQQVRACPPQTPTLQPLPLPAATPLPPETQRLFERLALQSKLSADLAMAKAELLKAQTVNQDMQQSIEALQQETQRNLSGVKP